MDLYGYTSEEIRFILAFRNHLYKSKISMREFMESDAIKGVVIKCKRDSIATLQEEINELSRSRIVRGKCCSCDGNGMIESYKVSRTCIDCKGSGFIERRIGGVDT